ncbi:tetratricopeptide repeat-containing sensor histidine kinase [Pontibacter roseus]|uniref:tetratricopeptide repeat-containing sensor histidine kinase n=1 Tax=Pontibacter roseus TaxID=336989 RepID=UPI00037519C7|nr:tetratricopeptide repeat-containing sensor histidine kinase [Pontibacter roseus]
MLLLLLTRCLLLLSVLAPQNENVIKNLRAELEGTDKLSRKAEIYCELSSAHQDSNPKTSVTYGTKAVELAREVGDDKLLAKAYNATGSGYYLLGDLDSAVAYYYRSLQLREKAGDPKDISASYNNIANIYFNQGNYKEALPFYKKSLSLATLAKDTASMSATMTNIGNVFLSQGKFDRALLYYRYALPMEEGLEDNQGVLISLINMGNAYNGKGDYNTALTYFNKALPLAEKLNSAHDKVYALRGKAEAYLLAKRYEKAVDNALESLEIAQAYAGKVEAKHNASVLDKIYTAMGNYDMAHHYLTLQMAYSDSINSEQAATKMAQERVKYETAQKDQENQLLRAEQELNLKELEQKNIIQYFTVTLLLLACMVAYGFYKGRQHRGRINQMLTQKHELIMQKNEALSQHQKVLTMQAEQLEKQKEELKRLNAIKDKLFSVIAHDLRGPLVALKGLLHVMAMGKVPADKQEGLFNSLEKGQQNVLWMLDNLFDWAKAQMDGFEVDAKPIVLRELADENIRLLLPMASGKDIRLENTISPDLAGFADKDMIRLVLRNLISNGIKFCRAGDHVTLSAFVRQGMLFVSVKDTGVGITPEVQQKLFGKSNYSSRGTANEKGSGLGLSLCKDFVEQNGGTIWVESEPGKGSNFMFTLPHATPEPAPQKALMPAEQEEPELV